MVHLYNIQRGVKDTSRNGTYHNKAYKSAAEEHGLNVKQDEKYGWAVTSLNDEAKTFLDSISDKRFELVRIAPRKRKNAKQKSIKYVCPICGSIVRATREVNVDCGDCYFKMERAN